MNAPLKLARSEAPAPQAILSIDPPTYVAAVYQDFHQRLTALEAQAKDVAYDITTGKGMTLALGWRRSFRDLRIEAEKARKDRKAPILEIGKLLDSSYKSLEAAILPYEDRFDKDIKAEEQRKEAIRAEAARQEQARIEGIQARIAQIRGMAETHGKTSEQIDQAWHELDAMAIADEDFAEFAGQARNARSETLEKLHQAYERVLKFEQEQADLERRREEHRRLVAEQEERDRIAAEKLAAEQAEIKRQREALEEEKRQVELRRKAAEEELDRIARANAKEEARQAELARQAQAPAPVAEPAVEPAAEPESPTPARPSDEDLIECVAAEFGVTLEIARGWLEIPVSPKE